MSRNLAVLVFLCLAGVQFVQALSIPFRDISKEALHRIGTACLAEVNLDPSVVSQVLKTGILSKDEKYKQFLVCSYKKQNYLSQDGKRFNYDILTGMLKYVDYTEDEMQELNKCKKIRESEPSDLVYENLKCILEGLKKIDRMREQNRIEGEDRQLETNVIDDTDGGLVVD